MDGWANFFIDPCPHSRLLLSRDKQCLLVGRHVHHPIRFFRGLIHSVRTPLLERYLLSTTDGNHFNGGPRTFQHGASPVAVYSRRDASKNR